MIPPIFIPLIAGALLIGAADLKQPHLKVRDIVHIDCVLLRVFGIRRINLEEEPVPEICTGR